jgi:hypothetical protein
VERIDTRSPVAWQHPLNRGLVSWWLPFGGWQGGGTLRDLCRRYDGTLESGPAWARDPRGFGALSFTGAQDVVLPAGVSAALNGDFTLHFWASVNNSFSTEVMWGFKADNRSRIFAYNWSGGQMLTTGEENVSFVNTYATAGAFEGRQTFYTWAYTAGTSKIFLNGAEVNSASYTFSGSNSSAYYISSPGASYDGLATDYRLFSRYQTPAEVLAQYEQSRRSYPDLLNRLPRPWSFGVVAGGGGGVTVEPAAASLTLTGAAPTVLTPRVVAPAAASLTLTGAAPTVSTPRVVRPAAASLTLTGAAPTVTATANIRVQPAAASLTLTGAAPTVTGGQGLTVVPGAASLTLTGASPTVITPRVVQPSAASLALSGFAPTVNVPRVVRPGAASLALTGFAPTVTAGANRLVTPGSLLLTLTGYAPTVVGDEAPDSPARVGVTGSDKSNPTASGGDYSRVAVAGGVQT